MMLVLDFDRADALHLAIALDFHARNVRDQHGVALPAGLEQLRARAWTVAKGDNPRQDTTSLAEFVDSLQSASVQKLAYSLEDIGQMLGLSVRSIQRLVEAGELPVVHIGGSTRVRHAELTEYVDRLKPSRAASLTDRIETKSSPGVGEQAVPGRSQTRRASSVPRGAA